MNTPSASEICVAPTSAFDARAPRRRQSGSAAIEYALIVCLLALIASLGAAQLGLRVDDTLYKASQYVVGAAKKLVGRDEPGERSGGSSAGVEGCQAPCGRGR